MSDTAQVYKPFEAHSVFQKVCNPRYQHVRWLRNGLNVHLSELPPDRNEKGDVVVRLDSPCLKRHLEIAEIRLDLFRAFEKSDGCKFWPQRRENLDHDEDRLALIGVHEQRHDDGQRWWHVPDEFSKVIALLEERLPAWAHRKRDGEPCECGHRSRS